MNYNIDEIREKFFKAMDGNNGYSIKDFDAEFNHTNHTAQPINTSKVGVMVCDVKECMHGLLQSQALIS